MLKDDYTMASSATVYRTVAGPLGDMLLRAERVADSGAPAGAGAVLTGVFFAGQKYFPPRVADSRDSRAAGAALGGRDSGAFRGGLPGEADGGAVGRLLDLAQEELLQYFAGEREAFTVPLRYRGSPFQQRVWQALRALRFGEITSYGALAAGLGLSGGHARAIGGAVGRNPLSVIVPCHRVLGVSGALTGYAGGVPRKVALLRLERVLPGQGGWTAVPARAAAIAASTANAGGAAGQPSV